MTDGENKGFNQSNPTDWDKDTYRLNSRIIEFAELCPHLVPTLERLLASLEDYNAIANINHNLIGSSIPEIWDARIAGPDYAGVLMNWKSRDRVVSVYISDCEPIKLEMTIVDIVDDSRSCQGAKRPNRRTRRKNKKRFRRGVSHE